MQQKTKHANNRIKHNNIIKNHNMSNKTNEVETNIDVAFFMHCHKKNGLTEKKEKNMLHFYHSNTSNIMQILKIKNILTFKKTVSV